VNSSVLNPLLCTLRKGTTRVTPLQLWLQYGVYL
jgi:hypothetical protein